MQRAYSSTPRLLRSIIGNLILRGMILIVEGIKVPWMIKDLIEDDWLSPLVGDDFLLVVLVFFLLKLMLGLKSILARSSKYSSTRLENLLVWVYLFSSRVENKYYNLIK